MTIGEQYMNTKQLLRRAKVQATGVARLLYEMKTRGFISFEGGAKALATFPIISLRYKNSTARAVEHARNIVPDRTALIDDEGELTYSELREYAKNLARHNTSLNLHEIHMGVIARNSRNILVPMTSKGYAGGNTYLLNIYSSPQQIAAVIKENHINILVVDEEFLNNAEQALEVTPESKRPHIIVGNLESDAPITKYPTITSIGKSRTLKNTVQLPLFPKHGENVIMSSGTTGTPKGIARDEPTIPAALGAVIRGCNWKKDMKVQITASMFHSWGWSAMSIALIGRNTLVMRRKYDPYVALEDIQKYKLDGFVSSPIFYKDMVKVDPDGKLYDTSSLKFIASSGHSISKELYDKTTRRFGNILASIYGSTELSLAAVASPEDLARDVTCAGKVAFGTELIIADKDGNELPQGSTGEIYIYNTMVLKRFTNPETPIKRIGKLVSIGDIGYVDDNGYLYVLGRADDMIIVGGENVHPQSVIETLESMPGVQEVFATGVPDEESFSRIATWIVPKKDRYGVQLTKQKVQKYVRDNLAEHSVPRDVHFIEGFIRTPTGKVIPRELGNCKELNPEDILVKS